MSHTSCHPLHQPTQNCHEQLQENFEVKDNCNTTDAARAKFHFGTHTHTHAVFQSSALHHGPAYLLETLKGAGTDARNSFICIFRCLSKQGCICAGPVLGPIEQAGNKTKKQKAKGSKGVPDSTDSIQGLGKASEMKKEILIKEMEKIGFCFSN